MTVQSDWISFSVSSVLLSVSMSRPEHVAPPEEVFAFLNFVFLCHSLFVSVFQYYAEKEAKKYSVNSRMIEVQSAMAARALELLALPDRPCYLFDLGCGSGLSGEVMTEHGHVWVGLDISSAMLGMQIFRPFLCLQSLLSFPISFLSSLLLLVGFLCFPSGFSFVALWTPLLCFLRIGMFVVWKSIVQP